MDYLKDTIKGISWMSALTILTKVIAVFKIAVLARILTPSQFGMYGIALLVLGFLEVLTETGVNVFLIQEKDGLKKYLNSSWVVSIIRGCFISLIIVLGAPLILDFFKAPEALSLLYLVALVALIRGFINPMQVLFQKKLEFMKVFIYQGILYLIDASIAIGLGLLVRSESALIIGMIAAATVEVIFSFVIFKDRPKFKLEKEKFLDVIRSGKWITGAGVFGYIFQNIDNVVVGRFLGTTSLGFYQQSYSISTLPVSGVSGIFNKVMFPVFVRISDDAARLKGTFYRALITILILAFVFGMMIFVFSKPIILLFLGPSWLVVEPTLKVLAIFGIIKSVLNSTYSLFLSLKKQKVIMFSELTGIVVMLIVIYPMVMKFGTVGAGYSALLSVVFSLPVVAINVKKIFRSL